MTDRSYVSGQVKLIAIQFYHIIRDNRTAEKLSRDAINMNTLADWWPPLTSGDNWKIIRRQ